MGATIFEKHIGLSTNKYVLNKYSVNYLQTDNWLSNARKALLICGNKKNIFKENKNEKLGLIG